MIYDKIAVIGRIESVLVFKAAGAEVFGVTDAEQARALVLKLSRLGYAVIFLTEDIAEKITETLARFKTKAYPAIIPIPGAKGSNGFGMRGLMEDADKAVGAELIFRQN